MAERGGFVECIGVLLRDESVINFLDLGLGVGNGLPPPAVPAVPKRKRSNVTEAPAPSLPLAMGLAAHALGKVGVAVRWSV